MSEEKVASETMKDVVAEEISQEMLKGQSDNVIATFDNVFSNIQYLVACFVRDAAIGAYTNSLKENKVEAIPLPPAIINSRFAWISVKTSIDYSDEIKKFLETEFDATKEISLGEVGLEAMCEKFFTANQDELYAAHLKVLNNTDFQFCDLFTAM